MNDINSIILCTKFEYLIFRYDLINRSGIDYVCSLWLFIKKEKWFNVIMYT